MVTIHTMLDPVNTQTENLLLGMLTGLKEIALPWLAGVQISWLLMHLLARL
jgi:hypothetical protein